MTAKNSCGQLNTSYSGSRKHVIQSVSQPWVDVFCMDFSMKSRIFQTMKIFWGRFLNSILTCFYSLNRSRCKECNIDPRKSIPFNLKYLCPSYYEQEYLPVRYLYPVLTSWNASHWYMYIQILISLLINASLLCILKHNMILCSVFKSSSELVVCFRLNWLICHRCEFSTFFCTSLPDFTP